MLFKISFVINCYAKRFHCVGYGKLWLVTPEHWLIISSFVFSQHHRLVFWTVPLHTISRKPIIRNSSIKLDFYMSPLLSSFRCDMAPHHPNLVMIQTLLLFKCKLLCYHGHLQPHSKSTKHTTVKWPIVKYTVGLSHKPSYNNNNNNNNNLT